MKVKDLKKCLDVYNEDIDVVIRKWYNFNFSDINFKEYVIKEFIKYDREENKCILEIEDDY